MKNEKTLNQLVLKAESSIYERAVMPNLKSIHELLNSYNIQNDFSCYDDNDCTLRIFSIRITLKNKATYYSRNTKWFAQEIIKLINNK
jgi:hypothetical protein